MASLRAVLDALDEGVCLFDPEGRVQAVNAAALELLGWQEDALLGRPASALADWLEPALGRGQVCRGEDALFRRQGGRGATVLAYHLAPVRADGGPRCAVLRLREAMPTSACDVALSDSKAELEAVIATIIDAVVVIDEDRVIRLFNPAAEVLFGYRGEEVLGRNVKLLMPPPDREAHDGYVEDYLATGHRKIIGIGREVEGRRKDGTVFPLYLSIGEAALSGRRLFVAILHDLSARRRTEEKLLTLSRAVEQSPSAVLIANLEGVVEYVNPCFTRLTGYGSGDIVGLGPDALEPSQAIPENYLRLGPGLLKAGEYRREVWKKKKSGEPYWALETLSPVCNVAGAVTHLLAIHIDITEQKQSKEALRDSEQRFRQVAEMSGEWLWEQDTDGCYTYSSGAIRQILGYQPEEILGKSYLTLLTEEDKQHWTAALAPTPEIQQPFCHLINRYRHKDGHEVFTESTGEPLFDEAGRLVKWRGVDHDVTARKLYEDALRLRDRAIEAASVGINIADARAQGNPNIYVNPALSRMTGYSREELLGQNMHILQGPDTDQATVEEISRALQEGRDCEVVLKNYRKEGTPFWNELLISPVRDQSVTLTHFIGVHSDVTERRRAEEERHELEIAKQIQLSLLPKAPLDWGGIQVAGVCLPATHVGGDYYDYFCSGDALNVVIADVSGHSVGAALVMAAVRSALKAQTHKSEALRPRQGAAETLAALNELLFEDLNGADLFISMFYLRYDPALRQLCYASAGHNCPLLLRENAAACQELDAEGMILGIQKKVAFEEKSLRLQKGDRLMLYTDGVTEAQDKDGEFFGTGRLCRFFAAQAQEPPAATIGRLLETLRDFSGGQGFNDDVSVVVLQVE